MTDKQRQADFEAFVRTNLGDVPVMDGGRYISPKINSYWLLWTASRKLALEEAAASCAGMLDEKEEAQALKASQDAEGTPDELNRLRHWLSVSTYNAGVRRCITAVMEQKG